MQSNVRCIRISGLSAIQRPIGLSFTAAAASSFDLRWIFGAIFEALFSAGGFALGVFVIGWVGKTSFNAYVTSDKLVRALGLAYVWDVIQFLNIIVLAGAGLRWITPPDHFPGWVGMAGASALMGAFNIFFALNFAGQQGRISCCPFKLY